MLSDPVYPQQLWWGKSGGRLASAEAHWGLKVMSPWLRLPDARAATQAPHDWSVSALTILLLWLSLTYQ